MLEEKEMSEKTLKDCIELVNRFSSMDNSQKIQCLARISDEALLNLDDNLRCGNLEEADDSVFEYIKSEAYARWIADMEGVAVKAEKRKNFLIGVCELLDQHNIV